MCVHVLNEDDSSESKCTVSNKSLCHMKFHNLDSLVFLLQQPKDSPLLEKADKVSHAYTDPVKVILPVL